MMVPWIVQGDLSQDIYGETLQGILDNGAEVETRGFKTLELLNVMTVIDQPWHHCHMVPGRRWNPWLAMSEALWILAGRNDIEPLLPYNKNIANFSDDGVTNYGAYGARIHDQIEPLIARLQADPNDRRAVMAIWNKEDLTAITKDPPCNDTIMFKLRRGALYMTVLNRSNDLHWGLYGVNLPTFGLLQEYIAARLQASMGTQTHLSNSLHVYTGGPGMKDNWRITEKMMGAAHKPLSEMPRHSLSFTESIPLDTLMRACNDALKGTHRYIGIPFLEFAQDFLRWGRNRNKLSAHDCRYQNDYADWMMAARIWFEEGEDKFS